MADNLITGIDIGTATIRIVVAQLARGANEEQLNIIGVIEVPAQGVSKGSIISIEDSVSSISNALENAERMIGLPIDNAWIGISGTHITSQESSGVIAISRTSGEIQDDDVDRVIEAARSVAAPVNYEVLHVIPKAFTIDNQSGVKDPVGMSGIRLEVTTQVIRGLSSHIKNLTKSIYRTGLDINDIILASLAASESVLSVRQKELGVALVDIGAATTNIIVFEEGDVLHTCVIPIGSDHITSDIAIGLQTSIDIAEKVKLEFGSALPKNFEKKDIVNLQDVGGDNQEFSRKYISEIIEARAEEMFEKIDIELQKINRSGLLPAGIVLVGGGAKLSGLVEVGKKKTMLPVSIGKLQTFTTAVDNVSDVSFATALGLVLWGYQMNQESGKKMGFSNKFETIKASAGRIKNWFKSLIS
ncbi:MAG TPA: cell division protein FtsA [Candidatus Bipolaricaulota bacterium]|nr:cell division protein FtsA [Candidatus Bipolaricaulota bacterium]